MESEIDKKVNAAVVALKKEIDSLLDRVMKENYELSREVQRLNKKLDEHMKTCGILIH